MGDEAYVCRDIRGQRRIRDVERSMAAVAGRQYGTITRDQLRRLGLSEDAIDRRLAAGRLHPIHRGVYAVGHRAVTLNARWLAAVMAGGAGAALSNQAAGAAWSLIAYSGRPHVTVPRWKRQQVGVTWHTSALPPDEVTCLAGIPITGSCGGCPTHASGGSVREERGGRDGRSGRGPRSSRGISRPIRLSALGEAVTVEDACQVEERASYRRPEVNAWLTVSDRSFKLDCVWRAARLIVELDGRAVHGTAAAFEADRERDRILLAGGWRVMRVTWRQLIDDAASVVRDVRAAQGPPSER
jgi:Transcriptional regulator, AbiEi antitoxin/Protein of unknown function (DUF559)